ncbi:MAG: 6-oxopurine nucleoside phosphorylase [Syntrophus sp. (in: bacteria)]|nr:6-oxopurine nucleoside phosphorylase [Syntrophus sp. (in: bacteria)]
MGKLGVISGTLALQGKGIFGELTEEIVENDFGTALVLRSPHLALLPRHGTDPRRHILPHRINHAANMTALKMLGVDEIIGINSTGSLKKELKPGAIVIPDDYILLYGGPTIVGSKPVHITPVLHAGVRQKAIEAARLSGIDIVDGGIYWQTQGPRFETRAEIALMSRFADIVGMTMAGEAVIAQELKIPYASICSVDNFAHGIGTEKLTLKDIIEHARSNTETIIRIILKYLEGRAT